MGYIKQLSDNLIKQIAAGEVIERPASVVKELVENSIDAGATKIEIEIERSGRYIKVSDNGMGIDPDDINLLFARHATSKIKRFEDLWNINSLGFRGEALASISAVSKIKCKSKHINQEYGFEITYEDTKLTKKTSSVSIGTVFEVNDLFYNLPARQKFLKSESTESGHILDIILSEAISRPKIAFKLQNNKNIQLQTTGSGNLKEVIAEVLGNDLRDKLISVSAKNDFLTLEGFISALEIYRSDRKSNLIFINGRPVKCPIILKAINSAFEGLLPASKYPVVVLNLKFQSKFVDVNVHPAKKEVRYTHPNDVYSLILKSIQESVSNHYKEIYKEKSDYNLEKLEKLVQSPKTSSNVNPGISQAAFDFYNPVSTSDSQEVIIHKDQKTKLVESIAFSVNNLKCKLIYSDIPIANMTKIGNKTIFEVGSLFDDNLQVVFSGEIIGNEDFQRDFFNSISDLARNIYDSYVSSMPLIQNKIITNTNIEDENCIANPSNLKRKKLPKQLLYEVWERDNWTCVYCGKQLLDPLSVKTAIQFASSAFTKYINEEGKEVTNHLLQEHSASYDHYLPVSKLPQFNFESENLFACCFGCNRKKLNSMELNTWLPERRNNWNKPLEIAGLSFSSPLKFEQLINLKQ
ncbi:MAG: hypothetical protein A3B68_04540 [Candidatus Melainabacteria bacterium RIFCSPHIGHO2_02_FULL_34_12]|nr:MAG: hypothetical protein A3B68_04540 [Candidatus Melainabacteria bacterium RIFCSPHIGHO2_02_FULL_34_12]